MTLKLGGKCNWMHVGIQFNGRVHCNVHPLGLTRSAWERDFFADLGMSFFEFASVFEALNSRRRR